MISAIIEAATLRQRERAIALTQPLLTRDGTAARVVTASCFLLEVGPHIAVVSASHALRRIPGREFFFGAHTTMHQLVGRSRLTLEDEGAHPDSDRLDIGVVILDEQIADQVDRAYTLSLEEIDLPTARELNPLYLAVGYPYSAQKSHRYRRENVATAHSLLLERDALSAYARHGLDPRTSIVLRHDREDVFRHGKQVTAPSPEGMSGGAIWRLRLAPGDIESASPRLAGVLIEHWQRAEKSVVATRGWFALHLLLERDPTLREWIGPLLARASQAP